MCLLVDREEAPPGVHALAGRHLQVLRACIRHLPGGRPIQGMSRPGAPRPGRRRGRFEGVLLPVWTPGAQLGAGQADPPHASGPGEPPDFHKRHEEGKLPADRDSTEHAGIELINPLGAYAQRPRLQLIRPMHGWPLSTATHGIIIQLPTHFGVKFFYRMPFMRFKTRIYSNVY